MNREPFQKALPAGSKMFLPDQAERKRRIETRLLQVFSRWGFRQIVTPAFDLYEPGAGGEVRDAQTFRLVDRETGGLLALRSDVTPQIARLAGTILSDRPRPLRLSYVTNVFRHAHVAGVLQREFWQAGVELIGLVSIEADVEMIAIAVECLELNGLKNIRMSLSHSAFIGGLLKGLRLDDGHQGDLLDAVSRRDASGLESLIADLRTKDGDARVFLELPELFGGEEILAKAGKRVKNAASKRAVEELKQVHRMLEMYGLADRVIYDLSDFRDFDYYTGVLFEGFVEGSGYPVCGGGRYDRLVGQYGTDALGTGIAIDLDELLRVAPEDEGGGLAADFLVIDSTREKRIGITLARELRGLGWRVARDIIRREMDHSIAYARQAGVARCLVVDRSGGKQQKIRIFDNDGNEIGEFLLADLAEKFGRRGERE